MVVVTTNILVTHPQPEETPPEARSAVLSPPEEPVSSEEEERLFKRTNERFVQNNLSRSSWIRRISSIPSKIANKPRQESRVHSARLIQSAILIIQSTPI